MKLIDSRLLRQAKSSRAALGLTIALGFIGGLFTVVLAWMLSQVINGVYLGGADLRSSAPHLGLLLLVFFTKAGSLWGSQIAAKRVALKIKLSLREQLYAHIQKLGPLYVRGERTGELVNTATEGIDALDAYFSDYLPQLVLATLVPLIFLFFVFPLDQLSGFVLLLTAPLIPIFMILIGDRADAVTQRQWRTLSRMSAHFLDVLQGLTTLKLFGRSRAQIEIIRQVSERFRQRTMGVLRVAFLSALVLELVATLSTAVVAVEIGLRLLYGRLAFEQALFVLLLAPEFYLPLRLLGTRFHAGMAGVTAAKRIFEILDTPVRPVTGGIKPIDFVSNPPSSVCFSNLSYAYPNGRLALQNVSFTIEPGQKVALVGPSGAGKSTIAALLLDWIGVSFGGVGEVAWLPQNPYLFNDTIAANIRIARPEASMDQVIAAAKAAHAHEFITEFAKFHAETQKRREKNHLKLNAFASWRDAKEYPGYNTVIGERGARLSGGQAQRIALARAFLMDAPFVILDEPTANLDPELETQIQHSLDQLLAGRIALIIAHRLQTIRTADKIIVLKAGQVVQQGNFDELAAQDGLFRAMVTQTVEQSPPTTDQPPPNASSQPAVLLVPYVPDSQLTARRSPLFRLLAFLRPRLGWVALSVLLGFLTIGSGIGLMGTSAYIISAAALQPSISVLQVPIVGVRFFGLTRGLFRYLERLVSHQTTFRVLADLRVWFYQKLEPLAPARLLQYRSSDLLSSIISDINSLENFYVRVVAPPLTALLVAFFAGFLLVGYAPWLALALWVFLVLAGILLPWWNFRLARGVGAETLASRSALSSALLDGIQGLPDLLAFGRGSDQLQRVRDFGEQLARLQARYAYLTGLGLALLNLLTNLGAWAVLVLAIPLVTAGQIQGVYLAVITLIALASFEAVQPLPLAAQYLEENLRAAGRLFEFVDTEPEVNIPPNPQPLPEEQTLAVSDLTFRYQDSQPTSMAHRQSPFTLRISPFVLPPGKRIAVVGPSGSGKTTLLNLLLRFWEFQQGEITLDGQDIRKFDPEQYRGKFAVVSQRTHLFNTSLRENLLLAKPDAIEDEIIQAAQHAQIHNFIERLPEGYETRIGEQGLLLSGGERQRIAIARALLKDAPILLLDEPTANLDSLTEAAVLESLHGLMEGRSTLLVTHRLVGMEWMDEILVLREGEIFERGTHTELLAHKSLYYHMWELQNQVLR
jgi:ATP-binding cassette subfamily C protein CydCD